MESMYLKRKKEAESTFQSAPEEAKSRIPALPNSLLLAMHGKQFGDRHNPELENIMKSRLAAFRHQIPAAENEADKLSSGITSGTPEQVKQSMGERLGTDFSSVKFHTGEFISQKADNMGARAWTQGNDVYFGEGGFHPIVAAHELVHTVQQGTVESGAVHVSAPMGGVQMCRKSNKANNPNRLEDDDLNDVPNEGSRIKNSNNDIDGLENPNDLESVNNISNMLNDIYDECSEEEQCHFKHSNDGVCDTKNPCDLNHINNKNNKRYAQPSGMSLDMYHKLMESERKDRDNKYDEEEKSQEIQRPDETYPLTTPKPPLYNLKKPLSEIDERSSENSL